MRVYKVSGEDLFTGLRYDGLRMNLGFFADDGSGEKTETATPRKKQKAREEGQVAKSQEVSTAFMLIAGFIALRFFGMYIFTNLAAVFPYMYGYISDPSMFTDYETVHSIMGMIFMRVLYVVAPMLAVALFIGLLTNVIQVGWHPTSKPLAPKFSKLNPIKGIKKIFSTRALAELVKSLLKLTVILIVAYITVTNEINKLGSVIGMEMITAVLLYADLIIRVGINIGILYLFIALFDFIYQRRKHAKELRMSKYEVKQEYKDIEGNPQIKSKIRQKMREASMRRMMQEVPNADVVITNPTHYAVAVSYDPERGDVPRVVAKGVDFLAMKIRDVAKKHDVVIVENKPLARALYSTVEIGSDIPPELWASVAEVIAYVYKVKNKLVA
jgi:flagellar biosynthetic protein FlhB